MNRGSFLSTVIGGFVTLAGLTKINCFQEDGRVRTCTLRADTELKWAIMGIYLGLFFKGPLRPLTLHHVRAKY